MLILNLDLYKKNCKIIRNIMNNISMGTRVLYKKSLISQDVFLGRITYIKECELNTGHCKKDLKCKGKIGIDENNPICICSSQNYKTACLIIKIIKNFIDESEFKI